MSSIKERAKEIKSQNGNEAITQKDLLFYIIGRLDDLEEKVQDYDTDVAKVKTQIKIFWILLPIALTLAGFVGSAL